MSDDLPADSATGEAPEDRVLILDFGSQFTQLIARRIREHHVRECLVGDSDNLLADYDAGRLSKSDAYRMTADWMRNLSAFSRNSRLVGSIQWASSNRNSTGPRSAKP